LKLTTIFEKVQMVSKQSYLSVYISLLTVKRSLATISIYIF